MTYADLQPLIRKALLQRIADDLAILAEYMGRTNPPLARCCYVHFEAIEHGHPLTFVHRLCDPPCYHAHHNGEVWLG